MTNFTYYGDLLGIGSYYKLSPVVAQLKLNDFYTEAFSTIKDYVKDNEANSIEMFSDTLFVVGKDPYKGLELLGSLYSKLLRKDILLRGAMVEGKLEFEHRLNIKNFSKRLPKDDILAKAAGLEKTFKGARFIIESSLVEKLLSPCPAWLTHSGYIRTKNEKPPHHNVLRKIAPTPDYQNYEYLYYWTDDITESGFKTRIDQLAKIASLHEGPGKIHFNASLDLIKRCAIRFNETLPENSQAITGKDLSPERAIYLAQHVSVGKLS